MDAAVIGGFMGFLAIILSVSALCLDQLFIVTNGINFGELPDDQIDYLKLSQVDICGDIVCGWNEYRGHNCGVFDNSIRSDDELSGQLWMVMFSLFS